MLNFHRAAGLLLPSIPRRLARLVDAAAQTPVPMPLGEDGVGAGDALASGLVVSRPGLEPLADGDPRLPSAGTHATTAPTSLGAGGHCGDGTASERAVSAPACETQIAYYPHPANRWELADERLGALLDRWGATP